MAAKGRAEWQGGLKTGSGTFVAGSDLAGEYSFATRFEDAPGANPEQLLAAAHAACFSMALAATLDEAGTPATSVKTDAAATIRFTGGAWTIATIDLTTVGDVPGVDETTFQAAARSAKENCPVTRALQGGSAQITLKASLA